MPSNSCGCIKWISLDRQIRALSMNLYGGFGIHGSCKLSLSSVGMSPTSSNAVLKYDPKVNTVLLLIDFK